MIRFVIENGNNCLKFDMPTCELAEHMGSIGICNRGYIDILADDAEGFLIAATLEYLFRHFGRLLVKTVPFQGSCCYPDKIEDVSVFPNQRAVGFHRIVFVAHIDSSKCIFQARNGLVTNLPFRIVSENKKRRL